MNNTSIIFVIIISIVLITGLLIEGALIYKMYIDADEIECNWIWCKFTQTRKNATETRECYHNGEKINCSEIDDIWEK